MRRIPVTIAAALAACAHELTDAVRAVEWRATRRR
jgi:hypothetical protein